MKKKGRMILLAAGVTALVVTMSCIEEEEEEKVRVPVSWLQIARHIDNQLGEISDGTPATCDGEGGNLGPGVHCKNRLEGGVTQETIRQVVRINNDLPEFLPPGSQKVNDFIFGRGFQPQNADNACREDTNSNGVWDYFETCINGPAHLDCVDRGVNAFTLLYTDCRWLEGATAWEMDGTITYVSYSSDQNEVITIATADDFTLTNTDNNHLLNMSGQVVRYQRVNPFTGQPALGTTGNPDGMDIIRLLMGVDIDGVAGEEAEYILFVAQDFEDGWVFLSGLGSAVWSANPALLVNLTFYARNYPWNGSGTGCLVDILNLSPATRNFNIASLDSTHPSNGCLRDAVGVNY